VARVVQRNAEEQYNKEKNDGNTNQGGEYNSVRAMRLNLSFKALR